MTVVCHGELLIDMVPAEAGRRLADVERFERAAGGAPANVAVGLVRHGVPSSFMGQVGADPFGDHLREVLAREGVDVRALRTTTAGPTRMAFVALRADGERDFHFVGDPSADALFRREDVDDALVTSAAAFCFGSISLIRSPCREATLAAAALARGGGALVAYDPNLRPPLWADSGAMRAGARLGLEHAVVMKASVEEAVLLAGLDDPLAAAEALVAGGLRLVALTDGARGCTVVTAAGSRIVAPYPVAAIDATGAGDAFWSCLLAALVADRALLDDLDGLAAAARRANVAGALATTRRGAIPSLPTAAEVDVHVERA